MKMNWQIMFLAVLLILMAVVFSVSYHFSYVQAKLAPMTISGLIIILAAIQLYREYRSALRFKEKSDPKRVPSETSKGFRPYLIQGLWMIGFVLAIALFGFLVAIPLFVVSYMRTQGVNWKKSLLVSASTLFIMYILFSIALEVELYPGLLREIFLG